MKIDWQSQILLSQLLINVIKVIEYEDALSKNTASMYFYWKKKN